MKNIRDIYKDLLIKYEKHITVINILFLYRYFSFLVTLIFYYFTAPQKQAGLKLIIILGMVLAYTTMSLLYFNNSDNPRRILFLGIVETVENGIFLVISGGFSSPFIWYFISNIFIAAVNLSNLTAFLFAVVYFVTASISTIFVLPPSNDYDIIRLYLNTAISYVILVVGILQLIRYAVKVEEKTKSLSFINRELEEAKLKVEKTLKYCVEMYETVSMFNLHSNDNILQKLINHMRYLTGVEQLIFVRLSPNDSRGNYVTSGLNKADAGSIVTYVMNLIDQELGNTKSMYYDYENKKLSVHFVMYEDTPCGAFIGIMDDKWIMHHPSIVSIQSKRGSDDFIEQNNILPVFMQIAGIVLKKLEFDDMEEQLLISEEQNRIANEIHDIVLQKLFAISCRLYVLSSSDKKYSIDDVREELSGIKKSIDITMKDLREAIYGLSWEKQGEDTFKNKLLRYTEEIRQLQGIEAYTIIEGDTQKIRPNQKHGMYRMICEAMNNAVRHGNAKHISVQIIIEDSLTKIRIFDDGKGFDYDEYIQREEKGLGLNNIYRIIELLNGHIEINTKISGGTEITMTIPSRPAA